MKWTEDTLDVLPNLEWARSIERHPRAGGRRGCLKFLDQLLQ
jgi:hypothetical protein